MTAKVEETPAIIQIYDYDTLMGLNHPDLSSLDLKLTTFFNQLSSYQITKEIRFYYPNKFNIHFNRNRVRPKTLISNDPEIKKKIRSTLSKVSNQNIEKMTNHIMDLLSQQDDYDWTDISELFYVCIIDNIFLVDLFIQILKRIEEKYPKLIHYVHHLINRQLYHPRQFENTLSESGQARSKRWQIANGLLIVHIYLNRNYSKPFLLRTLRLWLSEASPENLIPIEIMVKAMPKLKREAIDRDISEKLKIISQDKSYPTRLRLLINLPSSKSRKN